MSSSKISEHDLADSVFDGLAREASVQEVKTAVSGISKETTLVEVKSVVNEVKNMVENMSSGSGSASILPANADTIRLALLSEDERQNEWAFRQNGIGAIINDMFELNNSELAACNTVEDIAANSNALYTIRTNDAAWKTCNRSSVIMTGFAFTDPEMVLVNGLSGQTYKVGDLINLTWNGKATPFRVVHKDYYTEGKVILVSEDVLTTSVWDSSSNNYSSSALRTLLNGSNILGKFSSAIQAAMTTPGVVCHTGTMAETILNDKVFAPSYTEVNAGTSQYAPSEGSAWDYFTDNTKRIKKYNGTATTWWLRTPYGADASYVWEVSASGGSLGVKRTTSYGVVAAFEI